MCDVEKAVSTHDDKLASVESLCKTLQVGYNEQCKKLDDLESRSRRQNIRIVGIAEDTEKGRPLEFITDLIPSLLGP